MTNKLVLSSFEFEPFYLCGIYASLPPFKMAFLLNTELKLKFSRTIDDVEVLNKNYTELYPKYVFEDEVNYVKYTLIKNKYQVELKNTEINTVLFNENDTQQLATNLIPEFKNVDFFLKIETDEINYSIKILISKILKITQVITAFEVNYENIKSKNNLIFE